MKAYGVNKGDRGCCPGHDKYPPDTYRNRRSIKARTKGKKDSRSRARASERQFIHNLVY